MKSTSRLHDSSLKSRTETVVPSRCACESAGTHLRPVVRTATCPCNHEEHMENTACIRNSSPKPHNETTSSHYCSCENAGVHL